LASDSINVNAIVDARKPETLGRIDSAAQRRRASLWVTDEASRVDPPDRHDAQLEHACDAYPALTPVPVLVPPTGTRGALHRATQIAESARSRVARLCPVTHRYPLVDWVLSPIPEICERHDLTLLIDLDSERPRWSEVVGFARRFPRVPMVLLATRLEHERAAPAALDATPNLLLQLTATSPEIAHLVDTFGAARFVCGSRSGDETELKTVPELPPLDQTAREALLVRNAQALADGTYAERFL
jgi:hypothetical protein